MKRIPTATVPFILSSIWLVTLAVPSRTMGEPKPGASAQTLLEEAKQSEFDRKLAAKQRDLDRLAEDLKKGKLEIESLERSISKVGVAANESKAQIDQLAAEKKRLTQDLEVVNLRIDAEKLKEEGLRLLEIAHTKAREAVEKRALELDARTALVAAEMRQFSSKAPLDPVAAPPPSKKGATKPAPDKSAPTELQKQLDKAQQATIAANTAAREAMDAATLKLQQAEAASEKTEKKQAEINLDRNPSFPGGNDPLSSAKQ
jgi:hypothetical protein